MKLKTKINKIFFKLTEKQFPKMVNCKKILIEIILKTYCCMENMKKLKKNKYKE